MGSWKSNELPNDTVILVKEKVCTDGAVANGTSGGDECALGCEACGYNWYNIHCISGRETSWCNVLCGCCGGIIAQQDVCKNVCVDNSIPEGAQVWEMLETSN